MAEVTRASARGAMARRPSTGEDTLLVEGEARGLAAGEARGEAAAEVAGEASGEFSRELEADRFFSRFNALQVRNIDSYIQISFLCPQLT